MIEKNLYEIIKAYGKMNESELDSAHIYAFNDEIDRRNDMFRRAESEEHGCPNCGDKMKYDSENGEFYCKKCGEICAVDYFEGNDSESDVGNINSIRAKYIEKGFLDSVEDASDIIDVIDAGFTVKKSPNRDVAYVIEWEGMHESAGRGWSPDDYGMRKHGVNATDEFEDEIEDMETEDERYERLNNKDIMLEDFCREVRNYLAEEDENGICEGEDSRVFCNGCLYEYDSETKSMKLVGEGNAKDFCEDSNGDLTIHDEGFLSDIIEDAGIPEGLQRIAEKYGYRFERETSWSIGAYEV